MPGEIEAGGKKKRRSRSAVVLETTIPACVSDAISVDKNRARQILVPEQLAQLHQAASNQWHVAVSSGEHFRLTRQGASVGGNRPALQLPKSLELKPGLV